MGLLCSCQVSAFGSQQKRREGQGMKKRQPNAKKTCNAIHFFNKHPEERTQKLDPNARMIEAISHNCAEAVNLLLQYEYPVTLDALKAAMRLDDKKILNRLIEQASPDVMDSAIQAGHADVLKLLIEYAVPINDAHVTLFMRSMLPQFIKNVLFVLEKEDFNKNINSIIKDISNSYLNSLDVLLTSITEDYHIMGTGSNKLCTPLKIHTDPSIGFQTAFSVIKILKTVEADSMSDQVKIDPIVFPSELKQNTNLDREELAKDLKRIFKQLGPIRSEFLVSIKNAIQALTIKSYGALLKAGIPWDPSVRLLTEQQIRELKRLDSKRLARYVKKDTEQRRALDGAFQTFKIKTLNSESKNRSCKKKSNKALLITESNPPNISSNVTASYGKQEALFSDRPITNTGVSSSAFSYNKALLLPLSIFISRSSDFSSLTQFSLFMGSVVYQQIGEQAQAWLTEKLSAFHGNELYNFQWLQYLFHYFLKIKEKKNQQKNTAAHSIPFLYKLSHSIQTGDMCAANKLSQQPHAGEAIAAYRNDYFLLDIAIDLSCYKIAWYFIKHDYYDLKQRNTVGNTVLLTLLNKEDCLNQHDFETIKLLLTREPNLVNMPDIFGCTPSQLLQEKIRQGFSNSSTLSALEFKKLFKNAAADLSKNSKHTTGAFFNSILQVSNDCTEAFPHAAAL